MTVHADAESALVGSRPFGSLGPELLARVVTEGELVDVAPGTTIVTEGEPEAGMYTLLHGAATVTVKVEDERLDVGQLEAGDVFGELGMLGGGPRTATVVATEPSQVLRLTLEAIERLFAQDPAFGLAMARDLADRLQQAMGHGNQLQAALTPQHVELPAQDLSRLRAYQRRYYAAAARNLVKRHRLLVGRDFPRYTSAFRLARAEQQKWWDLFGPDEGDRRTPFSYHTSAGTLLLMRIVEDVGVNFRHLLHLHSEVSLHPGGRRVRPDVDYRLEAVLADVVALREDRVAVVVESRVHDPDDVLVQLNRETFVILAVSPDAMASLQESTRFGHTSVEHLHDLPRRVRRLSPDTATSVTVHVSEDMGLRYGKVSGDLNVVHTTKAAARLFGHPRPFVQGLCTANHVLHALTAAQPEAVQHLEIPFARPVLVDQDIQLLLGEGSFEVLGDRKRLLAFGTYTGTPAGAETAAT